MSSNSHSHATGMRTDKPPSDYQQTQVKKEKLQAEPALRSGVAGKGGGEAERLRLELRVSGNFQR